MRTQENLPILSPGISDENRIRDFSQKPPGKAAKIRLRNFLKNPGNQSILTGKAHKHRFVFGLRKYRKRGSFMENSEAVYDVKTLGTSKTVVLGLQHLFAMFGATVLVPAITGLNVSTTLLFAGLGTLLFHLITGRKVPAFLGSSFAFLGGYAAIAPVLADGSANTAMLPYACFGVAVAGLVYLFLAAMFKAFGANKVMRYFPPIVTGPIIICIGLSLAGSAISNCRTNWLIALVAILIVVVCNIWARAWCRSFPFCWVWSAPTSLR